MKIKILDNKTRRDYRWITNLLTQSSALHKNIHSPGHFIIILLHAVHAPYNNHCQIYRPHIIIMYIFFPLLYIIYFFRNSDNRIALVVRAPPYCIHGL